MIEPGKLLEQARAILKRAPVDQAELIAEAWSSGSTRFASNVITQHSEEENAALRLRVIKDGRQGVAKVNSFDPRALDGLVARALTAAEHAQKDPSLLPMLDTQPAYREVDCFYPDTLSATPRLRAERVLEQLVLCRQHGLEGAGMFATGGLTTLYLNSRGVEAQHRSTRADFSMSAFADSGAAEGSADAVDRNINSLSTRRVGSLAMEKAMKSRGARAIAPGKYDVVIEPGAAAALFEFLVALGFRTQAYIEKRNPLAGRLGEKLFSEQLSLYSNPYDPRLEGQPFDFEGFPTQPLTLIEKGVFTSLPHDRRTAAALGTENTGHGRAQPDMRGPVPCCVVGKEGDKTIDKLISSTRRGLYVTNFHYANVVDPMALSVTGMTRGGVWMIENGELAHPVKNMRFTESLFKAFSNIDGVGNIAEATGGGLFSSAMIAPAMRIRDFTFSSSTEF